MLFISIYSFSQKEGNSRIIIKLSDSAGIYNKVKYALVNSEFIVKDNGNRDTLKTYTQEYSGVFCKITAIIEGSTVILSGVYGYTGNPKKYQDIIYYKGSQSWRLLRHVASLIGDEISFSQ
jgi:hypothetical protein